MSISQRGKKQLYLKCTSQVEVYYQYIICLIVHPAFRWCLLNVSTCLSLTNWEYEWPDWCYWLYGSNYLHIGYFIYVEINEFW